LWSFSTESVDRRHTWGPLPADSVEKLDVEMTFPSWQFL